MATVAKFRPETVASLRKLIAPLQRGSDDRDPDRKLATILLALAAAAEAGRIDIIQDVETALLKHLRRGIKIGDVWAVPIGQLTGAAKRFERVVRVDAPERADLARRLRRLVERYQWMATEQARPPDGRRFVARAFDEEAAKALAGIFAIEVASKFSKSFPRSRTLPKLAKYFAVVSRRGDLGTDPLAAQDHVCRALRAAGITTKFWPNPFNADAVNEKRRVRMTRPRL